VSNQIMYWGVLCRKCSDPVVFGSPSDPRFHLEAEFARPGTICCSHGHRFIYFPRDFKLFASALEVGEGTMERNREAHRAVNAPEFVRAEQRHGTRWAPDAATEAAASIAQGGVKILPRAALAGDGPDPRRAEAQAASKAWWASWAARKVS
jgi:hypothetical protein